MMTVSEWYIRQVGQEEVKFQFFSDQIMFSRQSNVLSVYPIRKAGPIAIV